MIFRKITIERTMCYGSCPVYQATIFATGKVVWHGELYVSVMGDREFSIPKRKLRRLEEEMIAFHYQSFQYPEVTVFATDHPSCNTAITFEDGSVKKINHYLGDGDQLVESPLKKLERFEKNIERIAGLKRLIQATYYIFHLNCPSIGKDCVVVAENEKQAVGLVDNPGNDEKWKVTKIGKETRGSLLPYVVIG